MHLAQATTQQLYRKAFLLSLLTIGYNVVEGIASLLLGYQDEALTLMGFGVDSFVEVLSGIGIAHMIRRLHRSSVQNTNLASLDQFEQTALRITGTAFSILTVGLVFSAAAAMVERHQPTSTLWGIIIAILSIATMGLLTHAKLRVGHALHSEPIIADARCTLTCLWMSAILLISSLSYELFAIQWIDAAGLLGLAFFSAREGKECFHKARLRSAQCSCSDDHSLDYLESSTDK